MQYIVNIENGNKISECAIINVSVGYRQNHITITDRNGFNRKVFRCFDTAMKYLRGDNGKIKILKTSAARSLWELNQRLQALLSLAGYPAI